METSQRERGHAVKLMVIHVVQNISECWPGWAVDVAFAYTQADLSSNQVEQEHERDPKRQMESALCLHVHFCVQQGFGICLRATGSAAHATQTLDHWCFGLGTGPWRVVRRVQRSPW